MSMAYCLLIVLLLLSIACKTKKLYNTYGDTFCDDDFAQLDLAAEEVPAGRLTFEVTDNDRRPLLGSLYGYDLLAHRLQIR